MKPARVKNVVVAVAAVMVADAVVVAAVGAITAATVTVAGGVTANRDGEVKQSRK